MVVTQLRLAPGELKACLTKTTRFNLKVSARQGARIEPTGREFEMDRNRFDLYADGRPWVWAARPIEPRSEPKQYDQSHRLMNPATNQRFDSCGD